MSAPSRRFCTVTSDKVEGFPDLMFPARALDEIRRLIADPEETATSRCAAVAHVLCHTVGLSSSFAPPAPLPREILDEHLHRGLRETLAERFRPAPGQTATDAALDRAAAVMSGRR